MVARQLFIAHDAIEEVVDELGHFLFTAQLLEKACGFINYRWRVNRVVFPDTNFVNLAGSVNFKLFIIILELRECSLGGIDHTRD